MMMMEDVEMYIYNSNKVKFLFNKWTTFTETMVMTDM